MRGPRDIVVAGGMESMTNAPYLLPKMRGGARLGHAEVKDHMFLDGLEDAYDKGRLMGTFAEDTAQHYQFTREAQDAFAIESLKRAKAANEDGSFAKEIVPVAVKGRSGTVEVARDEQPFTADPAKIPKLKPAFREGGTVTAANSSSISDGAAALVLMRASEAKRRKLDAACPDRRRRRHRAGAGLVHHRAGRRHQEAAGAGRLERRATSASTRSTRRSPSSPWRPCATSAIPHEKVNVHGGACALGHPIGASGARIIVTLLAAMEKHGEARAWPRSASAAARRRRWRSSASREDHPHRDRHRRAGGQRVGHPD